MKNIKTVAGKAFNIGGGPANAVSLLEVIGQLAELSGITPEIRYGPRRKGDQAYYVSDIRRFAQGHRLDAADGRATRHPAALSLDPGKCATGGARACRL